MARNLFQLGILLGNDEWKKMATDMASRLAELIESEPGYFFQLGKSCFPRSSRQWAEVVIAGKEAQKIRKELHKQYLPFARLLGTESESSLPLFEGRQAKGDKTWIYVCFNKSCQLPVETVEETLKQLKISGKAKAKSEKCKATRPSFTLFAFHF